ncbi:MAG: sigma-70 family RNA polymerase sigma factor [Actinobacteria bacterium]|nr:sigma-70 family RNA polymerase sigma factor [Actinomycetota bacterium]
MRIQSGATEGGWDFDTFYRTNRSVLVRFVRLAGATEDEADDAVQTAFAALLGASYPIRDPLGWLCRTALNDYRCSNPRIPSRRRKVTESPIPPREIPEPGTFVPSAADVVALEEENHVVLCELALLPGKQRQVMVAHYDGLSHEQIAALLEMGVDAVRQNLSRARRTLRKRYAMTRKDAS